MSFLLSLISYRRNMSPLPRLKVNTLQHYLATEPNYLILIDQGQKVFQHWA